MDGVDVDLVRAKLESRMLGESSIAASIGRFVILDRLGTGGMGVVYAAYDPQLDRKVAIKLLLDVDAPAIRQRLLREAQAMARLAHPNVVTVFEIGEHRGQAFVAMELVEGQTLRAWLGAAPRTQREILRAYLDAGRGLAAVHSAELVHRDFKPDNAMIDRDGRVRVMDFGLVRADLVAAEITDGDGSGALLDTPLTGHDARLGTPAYMAPEQILGEATDARTDQFAFCVSLWEALTGARPFAGTTSKEVFAAVLASDVRPAMRGKLPAWIETALVRGLARDPHARHPSMEALLRVLVDDPTQKRRRWITIGAMASVVAIGIGTAHVRSRMRIDACDGLRTQIAWDEAQASRVRDGLVATGVGYAADTADRATVALGEYATSLADARAKSCAAHEVEKTWNATQAAAATACLDDATSGLGDVVELLATASAVDVEHAVASVAALPPVEDCLDPAELARRPRASDAALRRDLAAARAYANSGRYREALAMATAAHDAATAAGDDGARAVASLLEGSNLARLGESTAAMTKLERAFELAIANEDRATAFGAARLLAFRIGYIGARPAHAAGWIAAARAALSMRGRDEPGWRAELGETEGLVAQRRLDLPRAEAMITAALETAKATFGPNHRRVGGLWNSLGEVQFGAGRLEPALASYRESLATMERILGAEHPDVAHPLAGLGKVEGALGKHEVAIEHLQHALRLRVAAFGENSPMVAVTSYDVGNEYARHGDLDEARVYMLAALDVWRATGGDDNPETALALFGLAHLEYAEHNLPRALDYAKQAIGANERGESGDAEMLVRCYGVLGLVAEAMEDRATAKDALERALAHAERALGREHPRLMELLNNLANTEHALGEDESARRHYTRALELQGIHGDSEAIDASYPHTGLGMTNDALGDHEAARAHYERALEIREKTLVAGHRMIAVSHGYLGLHYDTTKEYERSREHYVRATAMLQGRPEHDASSVLLLLDWAHMEMSAGRSKAAVELAERAMALAERGRTAGWLDAAMEGNVHYTLAQALGRDDARGRAMAERALEIHERRGSAGDTSRAHIRGWLGGRDDRVREASPAG